MYIEDILIFSERNSTAMILCKTKIYLKIISCIEALSALFADMLPT